MSQKWSNSDWNRLLVLLNGLDTSETLEEFRWTAGEEDGEIYALALAHSGRFPLERMGKQFQTYDESSDLKTIESILPPFSVRATVGYSLQWEDRLSIVQWIYPAGPALASFSEVRRMSLEFMREVLRAGAWIDTFDIFLSSRLSMEQARRPTPTYAPSHPVWMGPQGKAVLP